ncbi:TPA: prephenate dehydratase [Candidatus Bathyarchaeota archaeon]|nr:prephenate dehydratase [Candidatus Bathyarchaeota archaeon]
MEAIKALRKDVDKLDAELVQLLKRRVELAKKISKIKKEANLPIHDPVRERKILSRVEKLAEKEGLNVEEVTGIYRKIMALCRKAEGEEIKVAFLGPAGTFCEQAAKKFFASASASFVECLSIPEVFRAVGVGDANFGVVPIENSLEGSVSLALDLLLESELKVCGEVEERVSHNLIARPGTKMGEVRTVISHPQALAQCRKFIEKNLRHAKIKEANSTAIAVKIARKVKGMAAIGTELAAEIYGMEILARDIEDWSNNFTRFLVLSRSDSKPTGNDKTSLIFSVKHVPGALHQALEIFAKNKINLTKIESRPTRKKPWEYLFYCDFEGHKDDPPCSEALRELKKKCIFMKILGSYPKAR